MRAWLAITILALGASACTDSDSSTPAATQTNTSTTPPAAPVTFEAAFSGLPVEGIWKCDPVFVDVNEDGFIDLAGHPRLGYGTHIWLGDGEGNWTEKSDGLKPGSRTCGGGMSFGDINLDGKLDLAVADHCRGVHVYIGSGTGSWLLVAKELHPEILVDEDDPEMQLGCEDLDMADVNNDGFLDIVAGSSDEGGINLYLGDGTGLNWEHKLGGLPRNGWANRVRLVDMNADGNLDVVASYDLGPRVWLGDGEGDFTLESHGLPGPPVRGIFRGLDIGDVNNDGLLDIVSANWIDGAEVFYQQPGGTWYEGEQVYPEMSGGATGIALADMDKDGNLDIIVAGRLKRENTGVVRGIHLILNDGQGGWTPQAHTGLPDTGLLGLDGIGVGDFDRDGYVDVALGSGLSVESPPPGEPTEPVVETRLLVWRSMPTEQTAAKVPANE